MTENVTSETEVLHTVTPLRFHPGIKRSKVNLIVPHSPYKCSCRYVAGLGAERRRRQRTTIYTTPMQDTQNSRCSYNWKLLPFFSWTEVVTFFFCVNVGKRFEKCMCSICLEIIPSMLREWFGYNSKLQKNTTFCREHFMIWAMSVSFQALLKSLN